MSSAERNRNHAGTLGWAVLGAAVIAWDALAPETLSHAFARGMENRYARPAIIGAVAVTAAHLFDMLPSQVDPFDNSVELAHRLLHPTLEQ